MANNDWLGKFKSRAKSVQETAKNRLEKLSETLDKKIKEAQEDLEKQRAAEASGPAAPKVRIWRPSADNPDGEIVAEAKPPPIEQPVVQTPPETPPAPTPVDEPVIIRRKRRPGKKTEHTSNSPEESYNQEDFIQKHSNELNEKTPTVDGSVESTAVVAIPKKEELILIHDSTSHTENKIDTVKQEAIPSKTEPKQEAVLTKAEPKQELVPSKTEPKREAVPSKTETKQEPSKTEPKQQDIPSKTEPKQEAVPSKTEPKREPVPSKIEPKQEAVSSKTEPKREAVPSKTETKQEPSKTEPKQQDIPSKTEPKQETVPSKTEPKREPVPSKAEPKQQDIPSKTEPKQETVPSKTEPKREPVPSKIEPKQEAVSSKTEPKREPVPSKTETKQEPSKIEPKQEAVPSKTEPKREAVPSKTETKQEPSKTETKQEPSKTEPKQEDVPSKTAKNRLEKLSETLDKKIKETQEHIEKQRPAEASEPAAPNVQIGRRSADNPDGEIVAEVKPPPIEQPVVQTPPETPSASTPIDEPITVRRKRRPGKKTEHKISSLEEKYNQEDFIQKHSNELNEKTPTVDESVESTAVVAIPKKEELILIKESTSHSENKIDIIKQEVIPTKTERNQEIIQTNIITDASMPNTTIDNLPVDHSDPADTPMDIPHDEQPASTNVDNLSIERFDPEDVPVNKSTDEKPATMNIDNLLVENSGSEDTPRNIRRDEQSVSTITDNLLIEHSDLENIPVNKLNNEELAVTNTNDSSIVDSHSENIPINEVADELPTSTNIDVSSVEHSYPKTIENKIPDDEPAIFANSDKSSIEHSSSEHIPTNIPEDKALTTANIDDSPKTHTDLTTIPQDISDDKVSTLTNITDIPADEHSDPEKMQMEISDYKLPTLPDIVDIPIVDTNPENILQDIPNDELSASTESDNLPTEHSTSENIKMKIPDDEPIPLSDIDDSVKVSRDTPNDELLASMEGDESLVEQSGLKNMQTKKLDDKLPVVANVVDSPIVDSNPENILQDIPADELAASTKSDNSSTEYSRPDKNIPINISDDKSLTATNIEDSLKAHPDLENISINISDDELLTTTDIVDSLSVKSGIENILMNIPDDELPALTDIDNSSNEEPDSVNILMNIPDNELPTINSVSVNIQMESNDSNLSDARPDSNNILMNIPDDELPTIENIVDLPTVKSSAENILMNVPDDQLPTLKEIDSKPKSSQKKTKDKKSSTISQDVPVSKPNNDKVSVSTNINDIPIKHPKLKDKLPTSTKLAKAPIKQSTSNENRSKISQNKIKTPPNELEDSFEKLKTANIPVHQTLEKPPQESTHLTALRALISKIEDDDDDDEEFISPKKDTSIIQKNITTVPEQPTTPNILKNRLSLSLTSLSDDTPEDLFNDTPAPIKALNDEPPIEETYEIVPAMSVETKPIETKRLSIVNSHSIPPGTKIQHINCSSTYIYLCTTDRKIFYAKLNPNDFDCQLNWQQHIDLADQLVVSVSNRTVWRLHNKILYTANDPIKYPPIGSQWNKIKLDDNQPLLSISINDQCGWFIKNDGTLWLLRIDDPTCELMNVACPFNLNTVFCFSEKVGVNTSDGEILIRAGCTQDTPEGGGWIFIEHNFGPIDDFVLLTNNNMIAIVDKKHHLWMHQWSSDKGFYEVLCDDDFFTSSQRYLVSVNSELLCLTDCTKQIHLFSDCLTGVQWTVIEKNTRLQRLIGAFSNEDYVWALTTDRRITSSNGKVLEKPRQAQFLTHATFVPQNSSQNAFLWSLDESCGIYVRPNVEDGTEWEQANQIQFEWNRRLINIVCNNAGVWAVDDEGSVHFRHGHISANQSATSYDASILPPAWITMPGQPKKHRSFSQVYCGPADWMVYATDNKQNVYTREGINEENRVGTSWKVIEDCSALELAISEHTLWLLTSCGEIQCRENISLANPIGTRSTTLSGLFLSLTVSMDDSQVWALNSKRDLLKLDRLTVLFEK